MNKSWLFALIAGVVSVSAENSVVDSVASGVLMREGIVYSEYATVGKFYYGGLWREPSLGENADEILARLAPRVSTPEEDIAAFLSNNGASSLDELAEWWGYGMGDVDGFLSSYGFSTMDEMGVYYGYDSYEDWVNDWWGYDPGHEQVAIWMGYSVPGEGDPLRMANDYGYASVEEMAAAWYGRTVPAVIDGATIAELTSRMSELTPAILNAAFTSPVARTGENFINLQNALVSNYRDGTMTEWDGNAYQDSLYDMLALAATNSQNPNGVLLSKMDFADINLTSATLTNMNLSGSNITGDQLNTASFIDRVNLSGMNLTGLDVTGKNVQNTNFAGSTGILASEVLTAANYISSNLSGLDFAGAVLSGKTLQGVIISGAENLTGPMLNGVTNVRGAKLEGIDLSGWTAPPYTGDWQTATLSLAGSVVNNAIMNSQVSRLANLTGVDLGFWQPTGIFAIDLRGVENFTGANIQGHIYWGTNMGTTDMTGYNYAGKVIAGNFTQVQNMTGTQLNSLSSMVHAGSFTANLSGRDLTGWQPTYNIKNANLQNTTGITASSIATATTITGINLRGTGITKAALDAALAAVGKSPTGVYDTSTIQF